MNDTEFTARKITQTQNKTIWRIESKPAPGKPISEYYATTYPGSESIYLETLIMRRPISAIVGRKLLPKVREAIEAAKKEVL